jgi:hypothetical protein
MEYGNFGVMKTAFQTKRPRPFRYVRFIKM